MDECGADFCCASVQKCLDTPAGIAVVAVSEKAWRHIVGEGLEAREECSRNRARYFRRGVQNLGLHVLADDDGSPLVTKVLFPEGIDPDDVRNYLRFTHNLLVGVGVRMAHFGANVSYDYLSPALVGLEQYLKQHEVPVPTTNALDGMDDYRV